MALCFPVSVGYQHRVLVLSWPCHCLVFFPVFFDILCYCKPGCGFWEGWLAGSGRLKHWDVCPRGGSQISSQGPEAKLPWRLYGLEIAKSKWILQSPDTQIRNPNAWKPKILNFYRFFFPQLKQTSVPPSQLLLWAVDMVGVQFFQADLSTPFCEAKAQANQHHRLCMWSLKHRSSPLWKSHWRGPFTSREAWLWADWSSTDFQVWDISFTQSTKLLANRSEPPRNAVKSTGSVSLCAAVLVECGGLRMGHFPHLMVIVCYQWLED